MKIGYWNIQTDIKESLEKEGFETFGFDWHDSNWNQNFKENLCDAYVWYPHLHHQWQKMLDRSVFIEHVIKKPIFPNVKTSYLFQDKVHQKYIFDQFNIKTPKTFLATTPKQLEQLLNQVNYPLVYKDIWGFGGEGTQNRPPVQKIHSKDFFKDKKWPEHGKQITQSDHVYLQECVEIKREYRVITVGQEIILSYSKKSDGFLKHVWRGAEVDFEVPQRVLNFVKEINKKLQLDWCGFDIIENKEGELMVLELNPIFGTKILREQEINLSDHIAKHIAKQMN